MYFFGLKVRCLNLGAQQAFMRVVLGYDLYRYPPRDPYQKPIRFYRNTLSLRQMGLLYHVVTGDLLSLFYLSEKAAPLTLFSFLKMRS